MLLLTLGFARTLGLQQDLRVMGGGVVNPASKQASTEWKKQQ